MPFPNLPVSGQSRQESSCGAKTMKGVSEYQRNETGTVAGEFRGHCTVNALEAALRVGVSLALVQRGGIHATRLRCC